MTQRRAITVALCEAVNPVGVWSEEAVANLVGQAARMHAKTTSHDNTEFDATVTAARIVDGTVMVELLIPRDVYAFAPIDSDWWNENTTGHEVAPPPQQRR